MSQIACKYHYDLPARWSCETCQIDFCTNCVNLNEQQTTPACVMCGKPLNVVGAENVVVPFWQRLHLFFMYPFNSVPLGIIFLLAVVIAALGNTLFGIITIILSLLIFMKYAYVVLDDTSHGYLLPRAFVSEMITEDLELPFKHILNIFLIIALNYTAYNYSVELKYEYLFQVVLSITLFLLPASVMILATKRSFVSAFNLKLYFSIVKNIGAAYILLYIFVVMMLSSASAAIYYLYPLIPEGFLLTVSSLIAMYFVLSIFNMLGYALYQYHEKIGLGVDVEVSSSQRANEDVGEFELRMPAMVDVEILIQEGEYKRAMARLEEQISSEPSDMHARGYYQKLLHVLGNDAAAKEHCASFVGRLMAEKKMTQAMKVFSACYKEDEKVTLTKPAERLEMAYLYNANGDYRLAMHLLNNLHKEHPSYSEIPEAYLLAAKMMSDKLNQHDKAIKTLSFVVNKYPHNKGVDDAREYLKVLESVSQAEVTSD